MKKSILNIALLTLLGTLFACSGGSDQSSDQTNTAAAEEYSDDPMDNKGIGPISSVELGDLDQAMADEGAELFKTKCSACHKTDKRFVGPALQGITERRSPEWIMNMILNPEEMVSDDPIAMELLAEYLSPMANQNLTQEEARKILEYFRTL